LVHVQRLENEEKKLIWLVLWFLKSLYKIYVTLVLLCLQYFHIKIFENICGFHTERFTDLGKLNFPMVVRFWALANFQHCPSCLQKYCLIQKWSKRPKNSSHFVNPNPWWGSSFYPMSSKNMSLSFYPNIASVTNSEPLTFSTYMSSFCIKISIVDLLELKCNNMQNSRKMNSGEKNCFNNFYIFLNKWIIVFRWSQHVKQRQMYLKFVWHSKKNFCIFIQLKTFKSKY